MIGDPRIARQSFVVEFRAEGENATASLKALLKLALRKFDLRVVRVAEVKPKGSRP